jgi:hypothetical protein
MKTYALSTLRCADKPIPFPSHGTEICTLVYWYWSSLPMAVYCTSASLSLSILPCCTPEACVSSRLQMPQISNDSRRMLPSVPGPIWTESFTLQEPCRRNRKSRYPSVREYARSVLFSWSSSQSATRPQENLSPYDRLDEQ